MDFDYGELPEFGIYYFKYTLACGPFVWIIAVCHIFYKYLGTINNKDN